jgi:hypothetical protein
MADRFETLRSATARALLHGAASTPASLRQAIARGDAPQELEELVETIRTRAYAVMAKHLDTVRTKYTEDELFEIVVAAAYGAAAERLEAARRALQEA